MGLHLTKPGVDIGVVVRDAAAALAFYEGVLGLERQGEQALGGGGVMHRLRAGDSVIKLLVLDEVPAAANPPGGIRGASGFRYLTLSVDDLEASVALCADAGYEVVVPIRESAPGRRIAMIADPDGNWVELLRVDE